jgi:hypothetical protein
MFECLKGGSGFCEFDGGWRTTSKELNKTFKHSNIQTFKQSTIKHINHASPTPADVTAHARVHRDRMVVSSEQV